MQTGHQGDVGARDRPVPPLAAEPHNAIVDVENIFCRRAAEHQHHFGLQQLHLTEEKRAAYLRFKRRWRAITGWPPIHDVGDVSVILSQVYACQHLVEELTCAADKRFASNILIAARRFADDGQRCCFGSAIEAQVFSGGFQRAAIEVAKNLLQLSQAVGGSRQFMGQ